MDQNRTAVERAFDLATSGDCATIGDIKMKLAREGYSAGQLVGRTIEKQLRKLIETHRP